MTVFSATQPFVCRPSLLLVGMSEHRTSRSLSPKQSVRPPRVWTSQQRWQGPHPFGNVSFPSAAGSHTDTKSRFVSLLLLVSFLSSCPVALLLELSPVWPTALFLCCPLSSGHLIQTLSLISPVGQRFPAPVLRPDPCLEFTPSATSLSLGAHFSLRAVRGLETLWLQKDHSGPCAHPRLLAAFLTTCLSCL